MTCTAEDAHLVVVLNDAFDLHSRDLASRPLQVRLQRPDRPRQYNVGHPNALGQSRLFAVPLAPVQAPEVAAHVVRLPVYDDVTVVDVTGEDGRQ